MAKTTWDVWVVLANDPNQTVAYLPRWKTIQFSDQLNDVGSATIEHDFSDPFFDVFQSERGDSLLEGPYALQIRRDGTPVFTFFIEDVQVDRAGTSQPLTIGGRGIAAALEWAIVLPEDFSNQARATAGTTQRPKFFDRLFPGYAYQTRVATTGALTANYSNGPQSDVPGAGARLTATSNGSINNSGIDGVTDLVVGDNILVKNQANAAHNGVYWIVTVGGASAPWVLQRTARADGSPISDLEVGNAAFVNEGTTNGYTSWSISSNGGLSNSNQVGSVAIAWTQVALGSFTGISAFYIIFKEADTGYEYSTKKTDFGTVKTLNGRGGTGYAVDWPLSLDSTLTASLGKTDSKGRVVRDGGNFNIAVGRTALDVLNEVSANTGVDWHVSPTGVISIAVRPFTTGTTVFSVPFGNDLTSASSALLFSLPMLETVETRTSVADLRTVVYGSDGFNLDRQISDRTGTYGFRESFIENTADDAPAVANITASAIRKVRDGKLQITAGFAERDGMVAWSNFGIGDKVLVEIDTGTFSDRIISAIGASVDQNGSEEIEVTFGDIFQDIASNLKYAANYGRLGAADIPAFTLRGTSSRPTSATGTSVKQEVQGLSNRVVVNWEPSDNTSTAQNEVVVYRQEQNSSGTGITRTLTNIYRSGNIGYATTSAAHGYSVGDLVNIYGTTNSYFNQSFVFITSISASVNFTFDSVGPDIPSGTYTSGTVARVVERHSTIVPSGVDSAAFENLGAPGRQYNFTVIPYTVNGQAGLPSDPFPFTASASAQIVLNGAIRSNNYVANTSGWTIESDGNAELNQVTVRNGAWVQGTLTAATLQTGTSNPRLVVNSSGLYAYNTTGDLVTSISASTGAFFSSSASVSGNITANALAANSTITSPVITGGSISGSTIDIGGADSTSFHVDSSGNMWLGAATLAGAPFQVSSAGALTATSAAITGGTIDVGGNDATSFHIDSSGNMWLGAATFASAPFRVTSAGALTATSATISGYIATGGAATDVNNNATTISGSKITTGTLHADRIQAGTLSASQISTGTLSADFISGGTIDASNINGVSITGVTISGSSLQVGDRILLPTDGGQVLLGTASGGSATQCYVFAGGSQGFYVDTSGNGSTWLAGANIFTNLTQFTSGRTIVGLVTGTAAGTTLVVSGGQVYRTSSKRELKENIQDFNNIALIDGLRPRTFTWKVAPGRFKEETEEERVRRESSVNVGFIAEEVEEASNGLLSVYNYEEDGQGEVEMYKHLDILALAVANIQDLRRRIALLESSGS